MSFQVPSNIPSFSSAQRPYEDGHWRASKASGPASGPANGHGKGNYSSKINEYFTEGQQLPMYKDKPHYAAKRRRGTLQRKRTYSLALLVIITLLWWMGYLGRSQNAKEHTTQKGGSAWSWLRGSSTDPSVVDWNERREKVRDAFKVSWDGYEKYAWGMDEYYPVSKKGRNMVEGGMGWIIVDALDTMIMMNLTSRVKHAREWISTSLHYNADHDVNTFETTIRMLGGLLSAHYLSTTFPQLAPLRDDDPNQPGEDLYIEKATDLADRILGAFDSKSGIPFASINLNTSEGVPSKGDGGASSTAEAATLQLEFKYLSKLTGESHFWEKVEKVIEVIDEQHREDGLLPIFIYANTGQFRGENIRLGSRGDSYYEYLIKQYLQTSQSEPVYLEMWTEALEGIKKHLLTYSKHASLTVLGERPQGLSKSLSPKMDHLVCFMPGTIALAVTGGQSVAEAKTRLGSDWTSKQDEDLHLAKELMKTCWGMYKATATGLAPEIAYFRIDDPPRPWIAGSAAPVSHLFDEPNDTEWRQDYDIHSNDVHNLQRPETVESLFYLYRITGDPIYREWGWEMFESFITHAKVVHQFGEHHEKNAVYAYTSLNNANKIPPAHRDNMESFWLAETLKYFWLLFGPEDEFPLDKVVINTEAHFFPRFEMGKVFKTGWERQRPRGKQVEVAGDQAEVHHYAKEDETKAANVKKEEEVEDD
jgi:endoplasmic reticulum Man9GlcNAc2 1,2-alpha-mannosidase